MVENRRGGSGRRREGVDNAVQEWAKWEGKGVKGGDNGELRWRN